MFLINLEEIFKLKYKPIHPRKVKVIIEVTLAIVMVGQRMMELSLTRRNMHKIE